MSVGAVPSGRAPRRVVLISSSAGHGKTTLGRQLAATFGVPFVELDAWIHGANWVETPKAELVARLAPVLAQPGWVIDGSLARELGAIEVAELIVWLDLPVVVWLPRLARRTLARVVRRQVLWNGNRETWKDAIGGRQSLLVSAWVTRRQRRRDWPEALAGLPLVRLVSRAEVAALLESLGGG
jgi:adenylate kinase family enzyme